MNLRQDKIRALIIDTASAFVNKHGTLGTVISVTDAEITSDLKYAKIFISVFPEEKEKAVFEKLSKQVYLLREYAKEHIKIRVLPRFEIKIDEGEKNRRKAEKALCEV